MPEDPLEAVKQLPVIPYFWEDLAWLVRTVIAGLLAACIGNERERAGKAAGLRTHVLVGIASATFVGAGRFEPEVNGISVDPLRVVAAVATGIGFLGAGIIFVSPDRDRVRGLTTAASIWATASIGIAVALDRITYAIIVTGILYIVLHQLRFSAKSESAKRLESRH